MGKLWVQYMDMIDLLRRFLGALRMGYFLLYLGTLQVMLPYFAASGHNNYAKSAHVYIQDMIELVFDGYKSGPTTKDMTRNRRSKGVFGKKVMFTPTMPLRSKKENFLSNSDNKQNVNDLLCEIFKANGIDCVNAPADADVMVAKKGIEHAGETVHCDS